MTAPRLVITLPHGEHTLDNSEHLWNPTLELLKQAMRDTGLSIHLDISEHTEDFIFTVLRKQ
jgi:hypothetical protein